MEEFKVLYNNRKASYDYFLEKKFVAGIILKSKEIKSVRNKELSIKESYCFIDKSGIVIKNMYIKPWENSLLKTDSTEPARERILLLTKSEIQQIKKNVELKGKTIVPTRVLLGRTGLVKVEIAIASGKKKFDKREAIKEKDLKKDRKNE